MSQLSLYIQNQSITRFETLAKKENLSISQWAKVRLEESANSTWPKDFHLLFGSIKDTSFQKPKPTSFKNDSKRVEF